MNNGKDEVRSERIEGFENGRVPQLRFGTGALEGLPELCRSREWRRVALVLGGRSFPESEAAAKLRQELGAAEISYSEHRSSGEPSPAVVDEIVAALRERPPEAVVGIGGGSVLDTGKAVAAAVKMPGSVKEYLEGVGSRKPTGASLPYIACPTTAGTGSEATKNAVLSEVGPGGFKKSLRHDAFVPEIAVIDPALAVGAPHLVTAGSGLDAITQLLEAYLSPKANPVTDAYAEGGLAAAGRGFERVLEQPGDIGARSDMAFAAFCSGVCLASAGLGVVHGAASPAGAAVPVPHGLFCGALLEPSVRATVEQLRRGAREDSDRALRRYSRAGYLLGGVGAPEPPHSGHVERGVELLLDRLRAFTQAAALPRLGDYGFTDEIAVQVAGKSGAKNHPVPLSQEQIGELLRQVL